MYKEWKLMEVIVMKRKKMGGGGLKEDANEEVKLL